MVRLFDLFNLGASISYSLLGIKAVYKILMFIYLLWGLLNDLFI